MRRVHMIKVESLGLVPLPDLSQLVCMCDLSVSHGTALEVSDVKGKAMQHMTVVA